MKKNILFAALAAASITLATTSCSNDDESLSSPSSAAVVQTQTPINYTSGIATLQSETTRGTSIQGTNYLSQTLVPNMKVWAYFVPTATGTGTTGGTQYVGSGGDGIVIKNLSTESPVSNKWNYSDLTQVSYWPTQALNFYAIIPASDASFSVASTVSNSLGHVVASVTVPTTVTAQKDILFAQAVNQMARTADNNTPVSFNFSHAMSQIVFTGKLASSNLSAEINSITICNVDQKGKVGFITDDKSTVSLSSSVDASHTVAKYSVGLVSDATLSGSSNVSTAKNLVADNGALMMLPQSRASEKWSHSGTDMTIAQADAKKTTYLAISCRIKNGNAYVMGTASTYATVYIPFEINWEQGKKYTYCIVFGKGSGGYDEDGEATSNLLPITYTLQSVTGWTEASGSQVEF